MLYLIFNKKFLLLFLIGFCCNKALSQNFSLGGTLNLGKSRISDNNLSFSSQSENKLSFSGNAGLFFEKQQNKNAYFGIEALWIQIRGRTSFNQEYITFNGFQAINNYEINDYLSYCGISIYYKYRIGKFGLKCGGQFMKYLFGTFNGTRYIKSDNVIFYNSFETPSFQMIKYDLGPKIGLDFQFTNAIRLRMDFYYGMLNTTQLPELKKIRQFTLGVNYVIGTPKI